MAFSLKSKALLPASFAAVGAVVGGSMFSSAQAATFTLTTFTGDPAQVSIELEQLGSNVGVTAKVDQSVALGDLRGLFFNVDDTSILDSLDVIDSTSNLGKDAISAFRFEADSVRSVGSRSNNLNGGGSSNPCDGGGCDGGLEIGTPGIGKDDVSQVSWTFTNTAGTALSVDDFVSWGARLMSVGPAGSGRNGSSKLGGSFATDPDPTDIPEPTAALALISTAAVAVALRRRTNAA